jgi:hypothetical protein
MEGFIIFCNLVCSLVTVTVALFIAKVLLERRPGDHP